MYHPTCALPDAEEGVKNGDLFGAVDGEERELVHPINLPKDKVSKGLEDGKPHSGHGASCRVRGRAGRPSTRVVGGSVRGRPIPRQVFVQGEWGLRLH